MMLIKICNSNHKWKLNLFARAKDVFIFFKMKKTSVYQLLHTHNFETKKTCKRNQDCLALLDCTSLIMNLCDKSSSVSVYPFHLHSKEITRYYFFKLQATYSQLSQRLPFHSLPLWHYLCVTLGHLKCTVNVTYVEIWKLIIILCKK